MTMAFTSPIRRLSFGPQRGLAATVAALLVFFAMGLIIVFTNRSLIFEQRTSANQYRYTKAFEAAEAGLEWTIAQLNAKTKIDDDCQPDTAGANAFRERYLSSNLTTGVITLVGNVRPTCVIGSGSYDCECPESGVPPTSPNTGPAFRVTFTAVPTPGVVRVTVDGCTSQAGPDCSPTGAGSPDATARVTALLGVLPAIGTGPGATLTAKGNVTWQGAAASLGVINTVPESNGITINAGGTIDSSKAKLTTIPGSPSASSLIANDTSLSAMSNDQMFTSFFGISKEEYKAIAQSTGAYVNCSGNCTSTVSSAIANVCDTCRFFWIEGDMDLGSSIVFGSTTNPVVLVVNGNINLHGNMQVYGLVYAAAAACVGTNPWDNTGGGSAYLQGAAVSECGFNGNGTIDMNYDPGLINALRLTPGSYAKIPGSWKDY